MPKHPKRTQKFIIGIDEVGRGPLAGPVTVCALALPKNFFASCSPLSKRGSGGFLPLRDSKKLSPSQREEWLKWIQQQKIPYAISDISPKIIDRINISQAANLAATRCIKKLLTSTHSAGWRIITNNTKIFLDGGLHLKAPSHPPAGGGGKGDFINKISASTIIKGDELVPAISLASIVAKVHRDKLMEKLNKKYPQYEFEKHKGYGTKLHYKNIKKYGISKIHRLSFLKNI